MPPSTRRAPEPSAATPFCSRPLAPASTNLRTTNIAGANSSAWWGNSNGEIENRLGAFSHHPGDGRLRLGDALQHVLRGRRAALQGRALLFHRAPDWLRGCIVSHPDVLQAHGLPALEYAGMGFLGIGHR